MTHINQRRDSAANWTAANPVLHLGEVGWETDTLKAKLGDGATAWTGLAYIVEGEVTSVNGMQGVVVLDKSDVGLGSVDNVPDANKPISIAQQAALDAKAPLASPVFTGNPTAPTPTVGDDDTSIATTEFVQAATQAAIAGVITPACRITRTAVQSIPDAVATVVAFTAERFDSDNMHDTLTNNSRITFTTAGIYIVGFNGSLTAGSDYTRAYAQLTKNGGIGLGRGANGITGASTPHLAVSTVHNFAAGDYVEVSVFQDNSANAARDLGQTDDSSPEFWAARLGTV